MIYMALPFPLELDILRQDDCIFKWYVLMQLHNVKYLQSIANKKFV